MSPMNLVRAEFRLLLRSRVAAAALALLFVLSALAVWSGFGAVARQNAAIDRVATASASDLASVAASYGKPDGDAGYAAYNSFLPTWDRPSPFAFAAWGQRDLQPFVLRVRALGLQSQLHESEAVNPELALPGSFDWAFVLIYLAPLVVIALTHDLISGEREAGRLRLLQSMPLGAGSLWRRRAGLRYGLVAAALLLPLLAGVALAAAPPAGALVMLGVALLYLAFWFGLSLLVGAGSHGSATNAAVLFGSWIVLTLLLPTIASSAIARVIPVGKGIDLTLAQREMVHAAWDIPKDVTFRRFFRNHPEWSGTPPVTGRFHWKWYYAMHQAGDEGVADQFAAYRGSLKARQDWTERLGWLLPGVAAQHLLHRAADTDLEAHLAYQDAIAAFHRRLRTFFYPYLFNETPFDRADFRKLPSFAPRASTASVESGAVAMLAVVSILFLLLGLRGMTGSGGPRTSTAGRRSPTVRTEGLRTA